MVIPERWTINGVSPPQMHQFTAWQESPGQSQVGETKRSLVVSLWEDAKAARVQRKESPV